MTWSMSVIKQCESFPSFAQHFHFRIHHHTPDERSTKVPQITNFPVVICYFLHIFSFCFMFYVSLSSFIPCIHGQNQVSWVRRRDWHILSSGDILYTNDARFIASHEPSLSTYTLQIKFLQKRDHGVYECQVSSRQQQWEKTKIEYEWGQ